jgi:hypothetical protein
MEVSGQFHAPAVLPPGKEPLCPLVKRFVGPESRSERDGEGKISLQGIELLSSSPFYVLNLKMVTLRQTR